MTDTDSTGADFLIIGEAVIDIVRPAHHPDGSHDVEHVGGSPANVALGLARLGHRVRLATALGAVAGTGPDRHARRIAERLEASGVNIDAGSHRLARTPTALATLDEAGSAQYRFDLAWEFDPAAHPAPTGHVHTGSIATFLEPGATALVDYLRGLRTGSDGIAAAHGTHPSISFDPNIRPTLVGSREEARARTEEICALADVVKASDEDLAFLYPGVPLTRVMRDWAGLGPALVVITRGGAGALACTGGRVVELPASPTAVVDTVGAGDSFMAGLLSGLADAGALGPWGPERTRRRLDPADCLPALQRALAAASVTVGRAGADLPLRCELGA
ncbi:carbohydrate kinase [Brevibacterium sp. 50QC2O2]|jgi:fructokinase|uniref:carbohydrate kinase family protein n=1 Tax=Brevibacterium TaxID=1696 RepID=UPI00211BF6A4|nr:MULTISPECIES: carbohydrate kinase [unclassified Brevibacterium]MCQ9368054.1 carbohydrate kinase [Brevibacterium sp. 91QC2O2]MCQ9385256.1 carbohydrate kinase [Brevibacterium sp. 68QC2CO]MCQ9388762.1 carbohydrate kinase [Brevibacterium sp. 50QC2O2]